MKAIAALVLLMSTSAFGKTHAPLPDTLVNAKTVYIVNQTGNQEASDTAYDQFRKWGKYQIVTAQDKADIIAVFTIFPTDARFTVMQVFPRSSPDAAFQTTERGDLFGGRGTPAKNCVNDLKNRMEK